MITIRGPINATVQGGDDFWDGYEWECRNDKCRALMQYEPGDRLPEHTPDEIDGSGWYQGECPWCGHHTLLKRG